MIPLNETSYHCTEVPTKLLCQRLDKELKQDCHLFSGLYVACQSCEGDLHQFFSQENYVYPPALSVYGELPNSDTKSDILKEFAKYVEPSTSRPHTLGAGVSFVCKSLPTRSEF